MRCLGCLKELVCEGYCRPCRLALFDGAKVPHVLSFDRPAYNQTILATATDQLSISGVQTKISLRLNGTRLEMVESGGQYILKPIPNAAFKRLDALPANEHLTMQMARRVFNMDVAENALVRFPEGPLAYITRRFDALNSGEKLLQEDFAQISQRSEDTAGKDYKYDCTYEEIGRLIGQNVATRMVNLERYFRQVLFNYMVHNGDAHAKNFSLVQNPDTLEYNLTPAYDLLCTRLHLDDTRTALDLFDGDYVTDSFALNAYYARDDFVEFARRLGLVEARYQKILREFVDKRGAVISFIDQSFLPEECKEEYKKIVADRIAAIGYSYRSD